MPKYDLIIVGGGPAGSSAAWAAAKQGVSVALLEREESIARTVRTSGVTWIKDIDDFGIPRDCYNPIKNFTFCSPNNTVTISSRVAHAAVLDVRKTYRWLACQARGAGADIITGTTVNGVLKDSMGNIAGVSATGPDGSLELYARMVIDASGFSSIVSKSMKLAKKCDRFGIGAEYEARVDHVKRDTWWLMVGEQYSPAGYAWIFPLDENTARIGVGVGRPESCIDPRKRLDEIIQKKIGPIKELGKITPIEEHYGMIPNDGLARKTVHENLILVGDSAGQANPLVLEGIRYAIRYGRLAGKTAAGAISSSDTSAGRLAPYERQWRHDIESKVNSAGRIQDRWIKLSDSQWDAELDIIKELQPEEFVDFVKADFGLSDKIRLAARHPMLAARQLFGMINTS